jgi:membrane protein
MAQSTFTKTVWRLLKGTVNRFKTGDPIVYSAAIAFFTIFSLPPTLIIVAAIAGKVFEQQAVEGEITDQISELVGPESAHQIEVILENVDTNETGIIYSIIGIATLLFSATVVFNFIQKALNSIWGVKPKPSKGVIKFVIDRLISFSLVITLGFLLMVSLVIDAGLVVFSNYLMNFFSGFTVYLMQLINFIFSFMVVCFIFALMFKVLPDAKVKWKDVWMGAVVTAVLFNIGKFIIGIILGSTEIASTYGAAGSLAAILLWVFYSTVILLLGAEFTYVYSRLKGRTIKAGKQAVNVEVKEVEYEK